MPNKGVLSAFEFECQNNTGSAIPSVYKVFGSNGLTDNDTYTEIADSNNLAVEMRAWDGAYNRDFSSVPESFGGDTTAGTNISGYDKRYHAVTEAGI